MPEDLVSKALRRALVMRLPPAGLLVYWLPKVTTRRHLGQPVYGHSIQRPGGTLHMSRHGNCSDNAHAEFFWSRYKAELLNGGSFLGLTEATLEIKPHLA